jgi:hypothetical protein
MLTAQIINQMKGRKGRGLGKRGGKLKSDFMGEGRQKEMEQPFFCRIFLSLLVAEEYTTSNRKER